MTALGSGDLQYPVVMEALGRFIVKQQLTNVCVLEFENGVIVTGSLLYPAGEGFKRRNVTQVFSDDDLRRLVRGY